METIETLKEKLMPLYQKMLDECKSEGDGLVPFCVQWGRKYPMASGKNILFVGKTTNGCASTTIWILSLTVRPTNVVLHDRTK